MIVKKKPWSGLVVCWLGITQTEKHEIMDSLYYDDMIHTSIENKG